MLEAAAPAVSADEPEVAVLGEQLGLLVAVGLESKEAFYESTLDKCFGFQGSLVLGRSWGSSETSSLIQSLNQGF